MLSTEDADKLSALSFRIHTQILTEFGNQLNAEHTLALKGIHEHLANMVNGEASNWHGRWALSAPIGFGKSSAVAAFISAAWQLGFLGNGVTLTFTAARVQQLYSLEHDLLHAGIPHAELRRFVSVIHASPIKQDKALRPSDTNLDVPILLVAHNKLRSIYRRDEDYSARQTDLVYFLKYKGGQRDMLLWDERCVITESAAVKLSILDQGYAALMSLPQYRESHRDFLLWFKPVLDRLHAAADSLDSSDAKAEAIVEDLNTPRLQEFYTLVLKKSYDLFLNAKLSMGEFMTMLKFKVRVLSTGIVSYKVVVPDCIENCLVLDASYGISELSHIDTTIQNLEEAQPLLLQLQRDYGKKLADLKDCSDLHFTHWNHRAGKDAVLSDCHDYLNGTPREDNLLSTTCQVVAQWLTEGRCILIWTHQSAGELVQQCLIKAGLQGTMINGKPQVVVDTYGRHDAVNHYKYCDAVFHLGIQQRDTLELKGAICGAYRSKKACLEVQQVNAVQLTEKAVVFQQSNGRGSSRDTLNGKTRRQETFGIWMDTKVQDLTAFLKPVYPGSSWVEYVPVQKRKVCEAGRSKWVEKAVEYLTTYRTSIKRSDLKVAIGADALNRMSWKRICDEAGTQAGFQGDGHTLRPYFDEVA